MIKITFKIIKKKDIFHMFPFAKYRIILLQPKQFIN